MTGKRSAGGRQRGNKKAPREKFLPRRFGLLEEVTFDELLDQFGQGAVGFDGQDLVASLGNRGQEFVLAGFGENLPRPDVAIDLVDEQDHVSFGEDRKLDFEIAGISLPDNFEVDLLSGVLPSVDGGRLKQGAGAGVDFYLALSDETEKCSRVLFCRVGQDSGHLDGPRHVVRGRFCKMKAKLPHWFPPLWGRT